MKKLLQRKYFLFAIFCFVLVCVMAYLPVTESTKIEAANGSISMSRLKQNDLIKKVHLLNAETTAYALTTTRLLSTKDTGATWQNITPFISKTQTIYEAYFLDSSNGWAVLSSGNLTSTIYVTITNDGGMNWKNYTINLSQDALNDFGGIAYIDFVDTQNGWLMLKQMSGSNFCRGILLSTNDGGKNWHELPVPPIGDEINFVSENVGWLTGGATGDKIFLTRDGGRSWAEQKNNIETQQQSFTNLESFISSVGSFPFTLKASDGFAISTDKTRTKVLKVENNLGISINNLSSGESITQLSFTDQSNGLVLTNAGRCAGFKTNCIQETRLFSTKDSGRSFTNITPLLLPTPENQVEDFLSFETSAAPPGGNTYLSNKLGFDKCTAAPFSQMTTWWNTSPFYDVNIYIGGQNRGCTQAQLTAQWVDQISSQGWGLIPTWVGLQSPCSSCTSCAKHSTDATTAEQQGRGEADAAHAAAVNLGMSAGTIVYLDMERYTVPNPDTGNCRASTRAFLNGWTQRMHELNNKSGVYGSPCNAIQDWTPSVIANTPDVVWMARWWLPPRLFFFGTAQDGCDIGTNWNNNQRIHQYQGDHNETWGGITFNIDRDAADGTVVGTSNTNKTVFHLPPADFDGDGKTDISIFRPDTGAWYVLQSTTGGFFAAAFGISTDKLMPGDYDGDGWVDFGVYRPNEGNWYQFLRRSINAGFSQSRIFPFGTAEDIPVTDDFDGDARTDFAVFRPSNGTWYIYNQSNRTISIFQFGSDGDVPVAGDYDGDGKADVAVWRPSTGVWYILHSGDGSVRAVSFGISTDKPVEGDYDGDGKWDLCVYRPSEGFWYMMRSTDGFGVVPFGIAEDIPATGDYDGDKKYDQTVFRPSTGIWYVNRSQQGFYAVQFGQQGDKPIPAAYTGSVN